MGFSPEETDRVARFWNAPNIATREGLKAVQMFEAIERGEIKALWVMATNPAVSLPRAGHVRNALAKLDLFVVSENVLSNDTINAGAHLLLPAAAWGEKDGTVTNSERRISRQRPFLPPAGEARPDWWMVAQVAQRLGFGEAFDYATAADVFREHAALSAFENGGTRDFDIGGLAGLSDDEYNALGPVQWPVPRTAPQDETRFFANGGFFTPDRKARLVAPERPAPQAALSERFPFRLNTGRVRDQWHTMTRSGLSARLANHAPEPCVEVHPAEAAAANLTDRDFARIATPHGSCVLRVVVTEAQQRGSLFAPIHWSDQTASSARIGELVSPVTDPFSGQPEAKSTPASIESIAFKFRGFALVREALALPRDTWWARVSVANGAGYLLASNHTPSAWREWAQGLFGAAEIAEFVDAPRGIYRVAAFVDGRLAGCLFIGPAAAAPHWDAVKALFEVETLETAQRRTVLSGRPTAGLPDPGPIICACFGVGLNVIRDAIANGSASVEAVGAALRAGTNCGSCLPELKRIVSDGRVTQAA
jgi:assimilatory nitrate reductase catalytic subunit